MSWRMGRFNEEMRRVLAAIDAATPMLSPAKLLALVVPLLASILVEFLTIHPYANGNGHMGRAIVWILLGRQGLWPQTWPLDDHPPYDAPLKAYRDGNPDPLETLIYQCIAGTTP